jgi:hypothetical protein
MKSVLKTADELWIGDLIVYTNTLHVVSEQRLTVDGEHVASMLIKPYLSDGPLTRIEVLRNPGYLFKNVTRPVFSVEPCGSEDDELTAVGLYVFSAREAIAAWAQGDLSPDGDLILDSGDTAHYGDFIGLIDTGEGFEYRVVGKERLSKHYKFNFSEEN